MTITKTFLSLFLCFFLCHVSFAQQDMGKYVSFVQIADSLYDAKKYKESAAAYQKAFDSIDGKAAPRDRYNAACSFAQAGNKKKAFYHLMYSAEHPRIKYKNLGHITQDKDLLSLHKSKKWDKLIAIVKANKEEAEKDLDRPLIATLDTIHIEDQKYRQQLDEIETKYGRDSKEMEQHWQLIHEKDSINLIKVSNILDERGWLGANVVGYEGNLTLFLVIQHADLPTQVKYLPMMREAVADRRASGSSLALLEDRVALRQGQRQIYGSQIGRDQETGEYYVSPLVEPEKVNERRASVGLQPIEDYINHWNMTWDVEKHKQMTAQLEADKETKKIAAANQPTKKDDGFKLHEGDKAQDFTVTMLDGSTLKLSDLKGKVVLLNFWTTTCKPCMMEFEEMPDKIMAPFAKKDFVFIPVSSGEEAEKVKSKMLQLSKQGINFNAGIDPDKNIYHSYASQGVPKNFIIDKKGVVRYVSSGYAMSSTRAEDGTFVESTSVDKFATEDKKVVGGVV